MRAAVYSVRGRGLWWGGVPELIFPLGSPQQEGSKDAETGSGRDHGLDGVQATIDMEVVLGGADSCA